MEKKNKRKLLMSLFTLILMFSAFANPIETKAEAEPAPNYLTFTAEENGSTVGYDDNGKMVQYSTRTANGEWSEFSNYVSQTEISLNKGDQVRFRGYNDGRCGHFVMSGRIAAGGSVTSLTDGNGSDANIQLAEECYLEMFSYCDSLTKAPELPALNLAQGCYYYMFGECDNLTQAPELPATTLAASCYEGMFAFCVNLTQAPELPATTLAPSCYSQMFWGCDNLKITPKLPATKLAKYCYYEMFASCKSLVNAPELPATVLEEYCYSRMFMFCTNLSQAPELPATNLAESCYYCMFWCCSNLSKPPKLPATKLAKNCYEVMFQEAGITELPELPATILEDECYKSMFAFCENISLKTVPDSTHNVEWKIPVETTNAVDWGKYMFYECDAEGIDADGIPELNKTYYVAGVISATEPTPDPAPQPHPGKSGDWFASNDGYDFYKDGTGNVRAYNSTTGQLLINDFKCDGTYTYYFQADGTAMKDRLTYHPDGIHVIYFDKDGHEVFSDFANVKKSIAGDAVDDMCFFNVYGYMYVDTLTYDKTGTKLYYVNPYGVLERTGWFAFSGNEFDAGLGFSGRAGGYGYANSDCSLVTNTYTYDWDGNYVYIQGDGHMFR